MRTIIYFFLQLSSEIYPLKLSSKYTKIDSLDHFLIEEIVEDKFFNNLGQVQDFPNKGVIKYIKINIEGYNYITFNHNLTFAGAIRSEDDSYTIKLINDAGINNNNNNFFNNKVDLTISDRLCDLKYLYIVLLNTKDILQYDIRLYKNLSSSIKKIETNNVFFNKTQQISFNIDLADFPVINWKIAGTNESDKNFYWSYTSGQQSTPYLTFYEYPSGVYGACCKLENVILPGDTITYRNSNTYAIVCCLKMDDGKYKVVQTIDPTSTDADKTYTIASYFDTVFINYSEEPSKIQQRKITITRNIISPCNKNLYTDVLDRLSFISTVAEALDWSNKTITCFGDSITAGVGGTSGNYVTFIHDLTKATTINKGLSGSKISEISGDSISSFVERVSTLDYSSDIIIIFGGTNDYWHLATDIGTFSDTATSTFYGAVKYIFEYIQNHTNNIVLAIFPPKQYYNNKSCYTDQGHGTFEEFHDAYKKCCNYYSIPLLDLFEECTFNPLISSHRSTYTSDGLHLNSTGYLEVAKLIVNKLKTLL